MQAPAQASSPAGGAASQAATGPAAVMQSAPDTMIHPGDLVTISVLNLPSYNISTRLSSTGEASLPLIGILQLGNMTVSDVQQTVRKALLAKEILYDPEVVVYLQDSQSSIVTVLGGVKSPGPISLIHPVSLPELIGMAGGLATDGGDVAIIRTPLGKEQTLRLGLDMDDDRKELSTFKVYSGDTVIVRKAFVYYALGDLGRPGGYASLDGSRMTALRLCSIASGYKDTAAESRVRILRKNPDGTISVFRLNVDKASKGRESDIPLDPNDIVYVPVSGWKQTVQTIRNLAVNSVSPVLYLVAP